MSLVLGIAVQRTDEVWLKSVSVHTCTQIVFATLMCTWGKLPKNGSSARCDFYVIIRSKKPQ